MAPSRNNFLPVAGVALAACAVAALLFFALRHRQPSTAVDNADMFESLLTVDTAQIGFFERRTIPLPFPGAAAFCIDATGKVIVAADSTIYHIDTTGTILNQFTTNGRVQAVATDDNNVLYAAHRATLLRFIGNGSETRRWTIERPTAYITSIAVIGERVYLADPGSRLVWSFDTTGAFIRTIGERDSAKKIPGIIAPSPFMTIAAGRDNSLWVVNPGRHRIENYRHNGDLLSWWGATGTWPGAFCGCCNPIFMAILSDGSFVTSEKGIPRVTHFSPAGVFLSLVAPPNLFHPHETGSVTAVDAHDNIYVLDTNENVIRVFTRKGR
jgi:hypothetical protein